MNTMWNDNLCIGEAHVDKQHKALFELIQKYFDTCNTEKKYEEIVNVIDYLAKYVKEHFDYEEAVQRKKNYPEYEAHRKLHEEYKQMVQDLKKKIDKNGATSVNVMRANTMIYKWLYTHIKTEDKKLGKYLSDLKKPA